MFCCYRDSRMIPLSALYRFCCIIYIMIPIFSEIKPFFLFFFLSFFSLFLSFFLSLYLSFFFFLSFLYLCTFDVILSYSNHHFDTTHLPQKKHASVKNVRYAPSALDWKRICRKSALLRNKTKANQIKIFQI